MICKILLFMIYFNLSLALMRPIYTGTAGSRCIRFPPFHSSYRNDEVREGYNDDDEDSDDDEDDDDDIKPYGNRSLAWTKRYRKLLPYEEARKRVLSFGHRSKEDWDECVENGWQGAYVPARPDEMYAKEWESWEEFLGLIRPYNETQNIAVNVLGLRSLMEYELFVLSHRKRAELLRIPLQLEKVYKDEWMGEDHFFKRKKNKE